MPLSAEDKLDIHELMARYCHAIDFGDWAALPNIFSEDGGFEVAAMSLEVEGLPALDAFFRKSLEENPNIVHISTGTICDGDGQSATASSYLQIINRAENTLFAVGRYQDTLVNTNKGWRIQRREVVF